MICKKCGEFYRRRHDCKSLKIVNISKAETFKHQKVIKQKKDENKNKC